MRHISRFVLTILAFMAMAACSRGPSGYVPSFSSGGEVEREIAWVDWDASEVLLQESFPMQVAVIIRGDLPSPCHQLGWEIAKPNANDEIHVNAFSAKDPTETCAAFLDPFEQRIELGRFKQGGYSIWVNDGKVGDF